jgi:hypothetical protein
VAQRDERVLAGELADLVERRAYVEVSGDGHSLGGWPVASGAV